MSGQLLVEKPSAPDETHLRARFTFTDGGRELRFVDQRTFGGPRGRGGRPATRSRRRLAHIAIDPLDAAFDEDGVHRRAAPPAHRGQAGAARPDPDRRRRQHLRRRGAVAGPAARRPARPTSSPARQVAALLDGVRDVLGEALAQGGTSFDSLYVDVNGQSGYFSRFLAVYGQADRPCPRCGTPIRRESFMNRSSYSCPHLPAAPAGARRLRDRRGSSPSVSGPRAGRGLPLVRPRAGAAAGLAGSARNLPDGRVEVVVEGPRRRRPTLVAALDGPRAPGSRDAGRLPARRRCRGAPGSPQRDERDTPLDTGSRHSSR